MIKIEDLHVIFNKSKALEKHALKGINLDIEQGSFVTVIGANGSGKSTLLGTLAGDILPTKGRLLFNNKDVSKEKTTDRALKVARVFQDPLKGSCGALTIEENMALAYKRGRPRGLSIALSKHNRKFFQEKISILKMNLENRLQNKMSSLSGGQRQAIALIMATLAPSDILLLDEHTAALDPATAHFIMHLTNKLVKDNKLTTLMVTHSMQQALDFGDRLIMIYEGEIILDANAQEKQKLTPTDLVALFNEKAKFDSVEL